MYNFFLCGVFFFFGLQPDHAVSFQNQSKMVQLQKGARAGLEIFRLARKSQTGF